MNLYDVNCAAYKQLPALTEDELEEKQNELAEYFRKNLHDYYMMLCNELRYYTIYTWSGGFFKDHNKMAYEFMDITKALGAIKGIEFLDNDAVEVWIEADDECHCYHLFDYTGGVVTV